LFDIFSHRRVFSASLTKIFLPHEQVKKYACQGYPLFLFVFSIIFLLVTNFARVKPNLYEETLL